MGNDNAGENARNRQEAFKSALVGKHLPVLTLDNKWYKLLNKTGSVPLKETDSYIVLDRSRFCHGRFFCNLSSHSAVVQRFFILL